MARDTRPSPFGTDLRLLQGLQVPVKGTLCSCCHRAQLRRPHPRPATVLRAVAAEDKTGIDASKIGTLVYKQDAESWQDVMAFAGPAPEVPSCHQLSLCQHLRPAFHLRL